jgi:type II secretory pathway pseudopilin PulG
MSILVTAKTKAAHHNVKEAFRNEEGAIDLASIMVGIIVIGLIGGVIAATVFAVIPWAQDNAAKQQLDSIANAQSAYIGLSTTTATGAGTQARFGGAVITATLSGGVTSYTVAATGTKVVGADAFVAQKLFDGGAAQVAIGSFDVGSSAHYAAASKSASGKTFFITDTKTQPSFENGTGVTIPDFAAPVVTAAKAL